jgi:hypothetical protein
MSDYTDATQVSNFLQRALTSYETAELPNIMAAVKIWLDKYLNSRFDQVGSTTRYYDGGVMNLDIDPCTAITEVKSVNDDTSASYIYNEGTEYVAEPQNETVKRELRKRLTAFPRGVHRVAVTASFSEFDGAVPADIQIAATRLSAGVINAGKRENTANVSSESLEGHSITYMHPSGLSGSQSLDGLAASDPTVASILAARAEIYVDNDEPRRDYGYSDDDGGLML